MSLFSVLLASLFFFFGLVAAMPAAPAARAPGGTVYYPACTDSTWSWVCMLSLTYILGRYLICWHCVQTYNSLNQSPCLVAAALLSTCNGGCELSSFVLSYIYKPCCLIYFAAYTLDALLPGYNYVAALSPATSSLCACNTVTYSLLSACSACQDVPWLPYDSHRCPLSTSPGLCI